MSYTVQGSGHGVDTERAQRAFRQFVAELDDATPDDGDQFSGQISGSTDDGQAFTYNHEDARAETLAELAPDDASSTDPGETDSEGKAPDAGG